MIEQDFYTSFKNEVLIEKDKAILDYLVRISKDTKKTSKNELGIPQYSFSKLYKNSLNMNFNIAKNYIELRKKTTILNTREALIVAIDMCDPKFTLIESTVKNIIHQIKIDHFNSALDKQYIVDIIAFTDNNLTSSNFRESLKDNINVLLWKENKVRFNTTTMNIRVFDELNIRNKLVIRIITVTDAGVYLGQKLYINSVYIN